MNVVRSIALVSPHAWPAHDDITWRIAQEAEALARRGHRVSILTPARGADLLAEGRRRLLALRDGAGSAALADPGRVLVLPLGRALPAGPRRRIGGPLDLSAALEDVLSRVPFDVVHVHEPLAPSPALAALRHARGTTAASFYRPGQLAGVAFVQPLLERAMGRLDLWAAASDAAGRAVSELFGRDCHVVPGGVDLDRFRPPREEVDGPPGVVVIARSADRVGLRFALRVLRGIPPSTIGQVTILGPAEAPWRTRAAIPKAFRDHVHAVADSGPQVRAEAFAAGRIALVGAPDDLNGSAVAEAMASGLAVLAPRSPEADALVTHGRDGLALPPFSRDAWAAAFADLLADRDRGAELGSNARRRAALRSWDDVAAELDGLYTGARQQRPAGRQRATGRLVADLRVHPGPTLTPREIVEECVARGVGVVAVVARSGVGPGLEAARLARDRVVVIPGQEVRSAEGTLIGLFLREAVPDGLGIEVTAELIHAQGGVVVAPHPLWPDAPSEDLLRRHRGAVDCVEALSGPAAATRVGAGEEAARLVQRFGLLIVAGSGATGVDEIGAAHLRIRSFTSSREFLDALVDAEPVQRRRGLRARLGRERRRSAPPAT